ncbi:MAG: 30S ribosome-binding factor RbfA [Chloroflexi bacterium]|nr:30S ribosome-binding factor RbfA [Chloroflexota bacterium]
MTIKSERVADLILSHLSQLMLTEVRDPRLHGVTIMEVRLDREIEHAEIFVNALGDETRRDDVMDGLRQAQGFLRKELASRLRLRRMPQLHFKWDVVLQQANHIEQVLDALADSDGSVAIMDDGHDDEQE